MTLLDRMVLKKLISRVTVEEIRKRGKDRAYQRRKAIAKEAAKVARRSSTRRGIKRSAELRSNLSADPVLGVLPVGADRGG